MSTIYGECADTMIRIMDDIKTEIQQNSRRHTEETGEGLYEHLNGRIKGDESMRDKLQNRGLVPTAKNALRAVTDAIGLRVVCRFIDDVYENVALLKSLPNCRVVKEKDYIREAKPNGYRSYHMILDVTTPEPDVEGQTPGHWFVEIQLRTIAMDTWAALEHELKYKKHIENPELIAQELHRCANELAACDVSMQALKQIIQGL